MRTLVAASALLIGLSANAFATDADKPLDINPLPSVSDTQPQRVAWENKSDSLVVTPVKASPDQNNFASHKSDPENKKR